MNHCLTIWDNASKANIERSLKVQKQTAKIILDTAPDESSNRCMRNQDCQNSITLHKCILSYKTF